MRGQGHRPLKTYFNGRRIRKWEAQREEALFVVAKNLSDKERTCHDTFKPNLSVAPRDSRHCGEQIQHHAPEPAATRTWRSETCQQSKRQEAEEGRKAGAEPPARAGVGRSHRLVSP